MNTDDWKLIKDLFHRALEQEPDKALAWLAEQVPPASEIYVQVAKMLTKDVEQQTSITSIVASEVENTLFSRLALHPGDRIGVYEIETPVGEGGMGAVFVARRIDDNFEQQVAIKIITGKSLSHDSINRFQRERQILANLNHKHIARLLDGGTTDKGLPYLVMEYVHGQTLLDYCVQHHLDIDQKISLFQQVCEAVHYAHKNLVVHRDIKSSNILVNKNAEVKLLDFGVAKILEPEIDDAGNNQTRIEVRILTPRSASPEQVKGEAITTGTDVYALGALLYEMLTGKPLFDAEGMSRIELERIICEQPPRKPSLLLKALANTETPEKRQACLATAKRLQGDLDTIILKAVEKEAEHRYSSVEALMEDIERYRHHFPILGRSQGAAYTLVRFLQRHTLTAALGSALVLSVLIATGYIWLQSLALREERNHALYQARVAEETKEFIAQLFGEADPYTHAGNIPNVFDLLDEGYKKIDALETSNDIKSSLLVTIGSVYLGLAKYDSSKEALDRAESLMAADPATRITERSRHLYFLGSWYFHQGEYAKAVEIHQQNLALLLKDEPLDLKAIAKVRHELATAYTEQGKHSESEKIMREVLSAYTQLFGDTSVEVARASAELAHTLRLLDKLDESLAHLENALAIYEKNYGRHHLDTAYTLNHIASTLKNMRRYDEALPLAEEGLEIRRAIHGEHEEVAASLGIVSDLYIELGELDKAEQYRRERMTMLVNLLGEEHPYIGGAHGGLGSLQIEKGEYEEALQSYRRACDIMQRSLPGESPYLIRYRAVLSGLEREYGDPAKALTAAQAAYEGGNNNENLPARTWAKVLDSLGRALWLYEDRRVEARGHLRTARELYLADSDDHADAVAGIDTLLNEAKAN